MTDIPAENYSPTWAAGDRIEAPLVGDERATLIAYLDQQRETFELKCAGLTDTQLREQAIPPSTLSLHGLLRHLAGVERWWFRQQFRGEDLPMLYYTDDDPEQDFVFTGADFAADLAVWQTECAASRAIVAAASLDQTGLRRRDGAPFSLRWALGRIAIEYARHLGHADLLRERLDGRTGV